MMAPVPHSVSPFGVPIASSDHGFCCDGEVTVELRASGEIVMGGTEILAMPQIDGRQPMTTTTSFTIETPVLVRRVADLTWTDQLTGTLTADLHSSGAVHLYFRVTATTETLLSEVALPGISGLAGAEVHGVGASRHAFAPDAGIAVLVRKWLWLASWNDVGAHSHRMLADAVLVASTEGVKLVGRDVTLAAGQTLDAAIIIRPATADQATAEATYDDPDETRYVPEGEYRHHLVWESDDVWLGPPIIAGCPQRPYDQLIPRPLGLNVLARKRFTWANEDFSLWRLTSKNHYAESGVKKAFALMSTQNQYGGWYEGVEFYNLPPKHHHMYDTYISGMFLLDAYDATGFEGFLTTAERARDFWCTSPPPANGHVVVAPDAWWYRWGGYINEFNYTDERCVLNTHSGATAFLASLAARTGDPETRAAAERGLNAVRWGLERGIQRGDGQFLYCLSQVDPTLERPGDPPYIKLDLVPQIEDVYTVATSYRLLLANRTFRDPVVDAAICRALNYWWMAYRAGTVYTYRAYATLAYAIAAGDLDIRYALALPEILRDPQHFTSMQRGLSAFVAPAGLDLVEVRVSDPAAGVEPVFLRRAPGEALFALVNVEQPLGRIAVTVRLPAGAVPLSVTLIDPAEPTREAVEVPWVASAGTLTIQVPALGEFEVVVLRVAFEEPS